MQGKITVALKNFRKKNHTNGWFWSQYFFSHNENFVRLNNHRQFLDVKHNLKCTLEEFYNGKTVKLKIARFQLCTLCAGKGIIPNPNLAHNPIQSHQICSSCSGKKSVRVPNELEFVLTPGSRNGYRKRLKGQGDAPGNLQPADIYLVVEQKPHTNFTRLGSVSIGLLYFSRFKAKVSLSWIFFTFETTRKKFDNLKIEYYCKWGHFFTWKYSINQHHFAVQN